MITTEKNFGCDFLSNFNKAELSFDQLILMRFFLLLFIFFVKAVASNAQKADSLKADTAKPVPRPGARAPVPDVLAGNGLAQHDFLYAGGWDTRKDTQTIFRVVNGKLVWTWSIPIKDHLGRLSEFSDIHQLSNGNVLYACKTGAAEVTQDRKIVWSYECPPGTECHSAQPVGLDKVFLCQNGLPAKVMLINKKTGKVEMEHEVQTARPDDPKSVHGQFRNIRMTPQGTYLLAHLNMGKVIE